MDGNRWEKESIRQDMAARLKCLRENYPGGKLSHATLSEELEKRGTKISKDSLIKYESGSALRMNAEALLGLADFYGVSTDFLLCRTDDPAPVCNISSVDVLGLSKKAIDNLLENDWFVAGATQNGEIVGIPHGGLQPTDVLSRLLEDDEFMQVIGNLSRYTSPMVRDHLRKSAHPADSSDKFVYNPFMEAFNDSLWSLYVSSLTRHFGNAAERLLKEYDEEPFPDK